MDDKESIMSKAVGTLIRWLFLPVTIAALLLGEVRGNPYSMNIASFLVWFQIIINTFALTVGPEIVYAKKKSTMLTFFWYMQIVIMIILGWGWTAGVLLLIRSIHFAREQMWKDSSKKAEEEI